MADNIERIEKLIALAGSANEHEARSAAFLACKLIREGGYRLVSKDHREHEPIDPFPNYVWQEVVRPAPRRPPPDLRPRRVVPTAIARARRSGKCAACGEAFEEGSDVAEPTLHGDRFLGSVHADCRTRWTVPVDP